MSSEVSLDLLLFECTKQTNKALDADAVSKFCQAVEKDLDGPTTAARLLGHKIQSPQEQESLNALCVADECVKRCGRRFQDEIGKFRFLNEIIKMISPKYFGDRTSTKVKDKCVELLYRWSVELRHEPKISDAYEMLKRQGIIDDDPIIGQSNGDTDFGPVSPAEEALPDNQAAAAASPDAAKADHKDSIFSDEEKSKLLARLLRSKHPDDLQAANRLIKNMVKQDEEKQEKISQRYQLLETVRNNVKLLNEMLDCYQMAGGSSTSDKDIIRELHQNIEAERPKLFKLASDTEDKDADGMGQILQVNDDVVQISSRYKQVVEQGATNASKSGSGKAVASKSALDDDLAGLDLGGGASAPSDDIFGGFADTPKPAAPTTNNGILDLFSTTTTTSTSSSMGFPQGLTSTHTPFAPTPPVAATSVATSSTSQDLDSIFSSMAPVQQTASITPNKSSSNTDDIGLLSLDSIPAASGLSAPLLPDNPTRSLFDTPNTDASENLFDTKKSAMEDLDFLGQDLLQKTKPTGQAVQPVVPAAPVVRPSLNQLKTSTVETSLATQSPTVSSPATSATAVPVVPLTNVFVPLDAIKPGNLPPLTVFDGDQVKIILHFAQNKPREDVTVMVISIMSSKMIPVKAVMFQAAVPKTMKVKLQPPSGTELPGFNPILPPSAITQVMTLANPSKERVKLKYKLSYNASGTPVTKMGDVLNFPL